MKAKIKLQIATDGSVKIVTVENAGAKCRQVTDQLGEVLGAAEEETRADTDDLYVAGETDLTVSQ